MNRPTELDRREFIKATSGAVVAGAVLASGLPFSAIAAEEQVIDFASADSLCHGAGWETLNPGFWQVKDGALRRRFNNYGDRARATGFPYHYETHRRNGGVMSTQYDPSLPPGVIYRNDWKMKGAWSVTAQFTYHGQADVRRDGDADDWKMFQEGYAWMGLAFGALPPCTSESTL